MEMTDIRKQINCSNNRELTKFINENFEQWGSLKESDFKKNIIVLNQLDKDTIDLGLARMITIKENSSINNWIASLIAVILAIVSAYGDILENINSLVGTFIYIIFLIVIFLIILNFLKIASDRRATSVYFIELLNIVKRRNKW